MSKNSYKILLNNITTFIFDVDGVMTDGKVLVTSEGDMYRAMDTRDGFALKYALTKGYKIGIISGGTNQGVKKRLELLGVNKVYLAAHEKGPAFNDFMKTYDLVPEEVLYMGDDVPDIPIMKKVGLATCPQDAVTDVKSIADYVSHKKGGYGCVREIIEQVMRVQQKWEFSEL
ncbi:MAG: KdsC family phosphatase [Flavobacteriaceae bacterium]|tara:strand:- start:2146 stop:2664 length:519 start_codon:yes stop_codon:yes gene_type:complete